MICNCKDFSANMYEINCAISMANIHSCKLSKEFIYFRYCPWCGKQLIDDQKEKNNYKNNDIKNE